MSRPIDLSADLTPLPAAGWSNRYIGIPWRREDRGAEGTHCWGLVRLVYAEMLDIALDDYGAAHDRAATAATIAERRALWPWRQVVALGEARPFDVIVFREGRHIDHVGILVEPRLMLHVSIGHEAVIEDIGGAAFASRISGLHRHVARIEGGDA